MNHGIPSHNFWNVYNYRDHWESNMSEPLGILSREQLLSLVKDHKLRVSVRCTMSCMCLISA